MDVTLSGGTFTLLANVAAYHELETHYKAPWLELIGRWQRAMLIDDVTRILAAFARKSHADASPASMLAAMDQADDYIKARVAIENAIEAAFPPKKENDEGGAKGEANPP